MHLSHRLLWPSVRPSSLTFHIFDFFSETAEWNSTKLDRKQDLNVLYQVCVFRADRKKKRWPPWPLIGWDIFYFSSETAERNSTKLDRKQDLNVFYQVCVFRADRKNKMAALASDWLRHFRLLLWNRWMEFNETWQEARSQRLLQSLCFSGRSEKQDGRPGLWLAETFLTSPLKPLNGIQRNLTGSKISTSSTKFVFFGPISKQKCPPWPISQRGGTLYSGARYVALWASCFCLNFVSVNVLNGPQSFSLAYQNIKPTSPFCSWEILANFHPWIGSMVWVPKVQSTRTYDKSTLKTSQKTSISQLL